MSAFSVFCFGFLTETYHIYSAPLYIFLWIMNGFSQSVGWPIEVAIMGNWFGKNARGTVMGVWSACGSTGNIIGTLIASHVLTFGYQVRHLDKQKDNWKSILQYPFLIICSLLFGYSIVVYWQLPSAPWDLGECPTSKFYSEILILDPESHHESDAKGKIELNRPPALGFFKTWLIPGVISVSLFFRTIKLFLFFSVLPCIRLPKIRERRLLLLASILFTRVFTTKNSFSKLIFYFSVDSTGQKHSQMHYPRGTMLVE